MGVVLLGAISVFAFNAKAEDCCPKDDKTPPLELIEKTPIGGLHNPYNDDVDAWAEKGHKKYLSYSCNGCHGGVDGLGWNAGVLNHDQNWNSPADAVADSDDFPG